MTTPEELARQVLNSVNGTLPTIADIAGEGARQLVTQLNTITPNQRDNFVRRYAEELAAEYAVIDPNGDKVVTAEEMLALVTDPATIRRFSEVASGVGVLEEAGVLPVVSRQEALDSLQIVRAGLAASCSLNPDEVNLALHGGERIVTWPLMEGATATTDGTSQTNGYRMSALGSFSNREPGLENAVNSAITVARAVGPDAVRTAQSIAGSINPEMAMNFGGEIALRTMAQEQAVALGLNGGQAAGAASRLADTIRTIPPINPVAIEVIADVAVEELRALPQAIQLPTAQQLCAAGIVQPNPIDQVVDSLRAERNAANGWNNPAITLIPNIPAGTGGIARPRGGDDTIDVIR